MGKNTGIEWTDSSWNPIRGCHKISPGCANCYMHREQTRWGKDPNVVVRTSPATFNKPRKWQREIELQRDGGAIFGAGMEPGHMVFTCSWSDWFIEEADGELRAEMWAMVRECPDLNFQILTKRSDRIADHLPDDWGGAGYPNVWLGVSVENQRWTTRIRDLQRVPAAVRFLSIEPMLGPIDLNMRLDGIHWVIVGGESGGSSARMMKLDWVRLVRNDCIEAEVAFFLKQLGGPIQAKRGGDEAVIDGRRWTDFPPWRFLKSLAYHDNIIAAQNPTVGVRS